ncbi:MAG: AAA family ATPase [Bacteroidetes bacterium]|nr:AAA family ATPase [Bacteroidota bacterium]MBM3424987.1 hypothetical protein [Bacteroidota bacterium]
MLRKLSVKNFVLIDALELDFQEGFTAITGETGSGKSILLGALNLLKGDRADFSLIGPNGNRSVVEAVFSMNETSHSFLEPLQVEDWPELVVRREIQKDGRSRAFVNDTPVGLQEMKTLMSHVLVIHSQYNTLELKDKDYQLSLLDALSGTTDTAKEFRRRYAEYLGLGKRYQSLLEQQRSLFSKQDYESFLLTELEALNLREVNYEELGLSLLRQEQKQALGEVFGGLIDFSEGNAMVFLKGLRAKLHKIGGVDPEIQGLVQKIDEIIPLMEELAFEASSQSEALFSERVDEQELLAQVDEYNRLLNKHRLTDQPSLLQFLDDLAKRSETLNELTRELVALESQKRSEEEALIQQAKKLNTLRRKRADQMAGEMKDGFLGLKLKDAQIHFELKDTEALNERGMIDLEIFFSANKGMELTPIHKAASGGELSRVMLLLQQLISRRMQLPCILFDEIDTGVSGDVAERMGKLLSLMGKDRQLLAITHLPQVAAKAQGHLKVSKEEEGNRTITRVTALDNEERIVEIARLLSGEEIKPEALQQAHILRAS